MGKHWRGNHDQLFTGKAWLSGATSNQRAILLTCWQWSLSARALNIILSRLGKDQGAENKIARRGIQQVGQDQLSGRLDPRLRWGELAVAEDRDINVPVLGQLLDQV